MKVKLSILLIVLSIYSGQTYGQTDIYGLKLYGFFQTSFFQQTNNVKAFSLSPQSRTNNTFWLQQMNLFLSKDISDNFGAFVNLEFTNTFTSEDDWGTFGIEEAWARYSLNEKLNIKAGLLTPKFNNLNEIKNRSILLPYIFRPLVYETAVEEILEVDNFVPNNANVQVFGTFPINDYKLDYSFFAGNSEEASLVDDDEGTDISGTDTTKYKLFGGRIGADFGIVKFGITGTTDKYTQMIGELGYVDRIRLGADLNISLAGFNLEAEYIKVNHSLTDDQSHELDEISEEDPEFGGGLDKEFYYANLTYNISDSWYLYAKYDYFKDEATIPGQNGVKGYSVGGGYRPVDDILLKVQYQALRVNYENMYKLDQDTFFIAASIFF